MKFTEQSECIVCDKPTRHALCGDCLADAKNAYALRHPPDKVCVTLAIGTWDNTWHLVDVTVDAPPDGVPASAAVEAATKRWRETTDESVDDVAFVAVYSWSDAS